MLYKMKENIKLTFPILMPDGKKDIDGIFFILWIMVNIKIIKILFKREDELFE